MSRVTLEKIKSTCDESDLRNLCDLFMRLSFYYEYEDEENDFSWPEDLMNADSISAMRSALKRMEEDEYFSIEKAAEGIMPQEVYWIRNEEGRIIGMTKLRLILTPKLMRYEGHVKLGLEKDARGQGYGKEVVLQMLDKCRECGLSEVLMTSDYFNVAIFSIVRKCGGKMWDSFSDETGHMARFYIPLYN